MVTPVFLPGAPGASAPLITRGPKLWGHSKVTYSFSVDLSQWDGNAADGYLNDDDFTLDRNVVVSDELPDQAVWNVADEDFISGMYLTEAAEFDGDAAEFADDTYVGQYAVVGQNLYINVGADSETNVDISATALINTVAGLTANIDDGLERFELDNNAQFIFSNDEDPYGSSVTITLTDRGDGVSDENKFSKTALGDDSPTYVAPGESAEMNYRFQVNHDWSEAVDITESYIVDHRDPNIFDFTDLDQTVGSISGSLHDGAVEFDASHFDLSVNEAGNLVIALNEAGTALIDESWAEPTAPFVVDIALKTQPVTGKQTISIENSATIYGSNDEALYWSETTSEASSFGNEAEVRKTVRDTPNEEWTQNLRAEVVDGELVQDTYVYNLAYIPHGTFGGVEVTPAVDELADNLEFLGFVTADNVDSGDNPEPGPLDIGGNLEAVYDEDTHTVTVRQQAGTVLVQEPDISANVLVRITDFDLDVPVVNTLSSSTTTITPSDGYPLSINKVDSEDDEVVIDDPDSRFNVLDEDDNLIVEGAFVEEGFLRVLDDEDETRGLVVPEPGTYYVEEIVAPAGYELSTDRIQVVVDEDGNSEQVTFPNVPGEEPEPEVGQFSVVKVFEDAEGVLEDVDTSELEFTVEYTYQDVDEETVTGELTVFGDGESASSPELPAGTEVSLSEVNLPDVEGAEWGTPVFDPESVTIADGETFAVTLTNPVTPVEEPEEPTYAIGDYVWIDANADGIQDEDEDPLEGVTVVLYDGEGNEVATTTTDADGRYIFDELPAGDYQVQFVLTEEQAELYEFTDYTADNDVRWDSDAGENGYSATITLGEDNEFLTSDEDYPYNNVVASEGIDPTWDAGVVLIEEPPVDPEEPAVSLIKGDGDAEEGVIENDANDSDDPELYEDGETRDIVINVTNTGDEDLVDVVLTDETIAGDATIESLVWTLPDGETVEAELEDGVLVAQWDGPWAPEEIITGVATLTLNAGDDLHTNVSSVEAVGAGSGTPVDDEDPYSAVPPEPVDPEEPTYAIGDYVWIDENADGVQDEDEDPLEGVTVVLYDGEGNEIARTETDSDGRYLFDDLPAGEYQVGFELTDEQAELYGFTTKQTGDDVSQDSDANVSTGLTPVFILGEDSPGLTQDYDRDFTATGGIDPTWDAGVVLLEETEPAPTPTEPGESPTPTEPEPSDEPTETTPTPTVPEESPSPTEPDPTDEPTESTPAPTESEESPTPTQPDESSIPTDKADEEEEGLAVTGVAVGSMLAAALALLLGGLLLRQWSNRRRAAEF